MWHVTRKQATCLLNGHFEAAILPTKMNNIERTWLTSMIKYYWLRDCIFSQSIALNRFLECGPWSDTWPAPCSKPSKVSSDTEYGTTYIKCLMLRMNEFCVKNVLHIYDLSVNEHTTKFKGKLKNKSNTFVFLILLYFPIFHYSQHFPNTPFIACHTKSFPRNNGRHFYLVSHKIFYICNIFSRNFLTHLKHHYNVLLCGYDVLKL